MIKKKILTVCLAWMLFLSMSFFFVPVRAQAQATSATYGSGCGNIFDYVTSLSRRAQKGEITNPNEILDSTLCLVIGAINFLVDMGLVVATFYVMLAGVSYMTATGNPTKQAAATKKLTTSIVGFALLISVYAIFSFFVNFIEYNSYVAQFGGTKAGITLPSIPDPFGSGGGGSSSNGGFSSNSEGILGVTVNLSACKADKDQQKAFDDKAKEQEFYYGGKDENKVFDTWSVSNNAGTRYVDSNPQELANSEDAMKFFCGENRDDRSNLMGTVDSICELGKGMSCKAWSVWNDIATNILIQDKKEYGGLYPSAYTYGNCPNTYYQKSMDITVEPDNINGDYYLYFHYMQPEDSLPNKSKYYQVYKDKWKWDGGSSYFKLVARKIEEEGAKARLQEVLSSVGNFAGPSAREGTSGIWTMDNRWKAEWWDPVAEKPDYHAISDFLGNEYTESGFGKLGGPAYCQCPDWDIPPREIWEYRKQGKKYPPGSRLECQEYIFKF